MVLGVMVPMLFMIDGEKCACAASHALAACAVVSLYVRSVVYTPGCQIHLQQ